MLIGRRVTSRQSRPYDGARRAAGAELTRAAIVDAARRRFLSQGYATTTVAEIAADACVSVESVYKGFGGKCGLLRAARDVALAGTGPVHAEVRSDAMKLSTGDPAEIINGWTTLMQQVAPRVVPILLLMRAAAASDPDAAVMHETMEEDRRRRMRHNARRLQATGQLRRGLSLSQAADVLWLYSAPELFERLVIQRRWTVHRFTRFIRDAMMAALIDSGPA